ncbi:MAG: serine hydrolase [Lachnospiraceae bacterium]|nr:serine hydrolase [Lachnospiraceae bacterium]
MKCTNKNLTVFLLSFSLLFCGGCGKGAYEMPYTASSEVSSFRIINTEANRDLADPFAADLCVADSDISLDSVDMSRASGAALFDLNGKSTLYAKNVHEKLYPASLTKILTALVAIKHGSTDMKLTASGNVRLLESGAQVCGIKEGDQMTLDQALHLLLINSANDAAVVVAEGVGGSLEGFAEMMNQEAEELGATNSHFVNPHGLPDDNHYTTVYDMYLIMNEAIKYQLFNEIIQMDSYSTVYYDKNGAEKEVSVNNTNAYIHGEAQAPGGITVLGGKTGTTNAAGNCLVLISRDSSSNPYISIIMRSEGREALYEQMTDLLEEIVN